MEIIILLNRNIRYRKWTFISIVLLTLIISMSLTAIVSVNDNCVRSIEKAHQSADTGNIISMISDRKLDDQLLLSLNSHKTVARIKDERSVCADQTVINGVENGNSWMMMKLRDDVKLLNSQLNGFEKETPALNRGEIYIPQGVMLNQKCHVGDTVQLSTIGGNYELKVKGIVMEPFMGASVIGWKVVYVNEHDFEMMFADAKEAESDEKTSDIHVLQIYKSSDCKLTDGQFKRQLNLDTGIIDNGTGSLTREMSIYYTSLFPKIISSILSVFIGLLFVIVLIVMWHSLSAGIEMDYVNLGALKTQGFENRKIRLIFLLQYALAEMAGVLLGMILAVPLIARLTGVFQPITAILAENHISTLKSLCLLSIFLLLSCVFISYLTKKVGKISPIAAISGARSEIYFDDRIKSPICQTPLLASLALRCFTSKKRNFMGMLAIVSILVFFMMTITVLGNALNSKSAIESMGFMYTDCDVTLLEKLSEKQYAEIEETIENYGPIMNKYYISAQYFSINGDENRCEVYKNPESIKTLKGRAPLYDNEIVITDILAKDLNLKIGDQIMVSYQDKKFKYLIAGIFQNMSDTGRCFAMSLEGANKMGVDCITYAGYSLECPEKAKEIVEALNQKFPALLKAKAVDNLIDKSYTIAINAMKAVIFCFSVIFSLVVVLMVCTKAFLQEKNDIGVYKAIGFTARQLRLQFAIRFLLVAFVGSLLGALLCLLFSEKLLTGLLRGVGITSFVVRYTPFSFLAPIALICLCFFFFSYFISRKIKKVEVRELMTE